MTLAVKIEMWVLDEIINAEHNLSNAALSLGIARNTLTDKCEKYGVLRTSGNGVNPNAVIRRREELRKEHGC